MHVSVTRLRLASWLTIPAFLSASGAAARQAKASTGFLRGRLLVDKRRVFWTLTAWSDIEAMKAYRDTGAHAAIMPKLLDWCDEAAVAYWQAEDEGLPSWRQAHERIAAQGRASRIRRPSPAHAGLTFPPPNVSRLRDQAI